MSSEPSATSRTTEEGSALPDGVAVPEASNPATGIVFWLAMAIGAVLVAVGLRGLLTSHVTWLFSMAAWFVAGGVLVDLVLIPVVALIGLGGRSVLPEWAWRVVRAGLVATALLVAFSLVPILQPNGHSDNKSLLPRNYSQGLFVYLLVIWALVAGGLVASWFAARSTTSASPVAGAHESAGEALG